MDLRALSLIVGSRGLELRHCHAQIIATRQHVAYLDEELTQLTSEREELTKDKTATDSHRARFATVKDIYYASRRRVDGLRRREAELRTQLASTPKRIIATLQALVSTASSSIVHMEKEHRKLVEELHSTEKDMDQQKIAYGAAADAAKRMEQPIDSVQFAIDALREKREAATTEITQQNEQIKRMITESIQLTSISMMSRRDWKDKQSLLNDALRLKSVLSLRSNLSNPTDFPTVEQVSMPMIGDNMGHRQCRTIGKMTFTGKGTAHKKVHRRTTNGSRSSWKKIDVTFTGGETVSHRWQHPIWMHPEYSQQLGRHVASLFSTGLNDVLGTMDEGMLQDVNAEVDELMTRIHHSLFHEA